MEIEIGDGVGFNRTWGIVDKLEGAPPSNIDPKVKKEIPKAYEEGNIHHCAQLDRHQLVHIIKEL